MPLDAGPNSKAITDVVFDMEDSVREALNSAWLIYDKLSQRGCFGGGTEGDAYCMLAGRGLSAAQNSRSMASAVQGDGRQSMKPVSRRSVMAGSAAVVAAVSVVGLSKVEGPSELAALIKRYFGEIAIFNATKHETDEESDAHAEATFELTMDAIYDLPVRTNEDAFAVVDVLIREHCVDWQWAEAMVHELHAYLAAKVA